MLQYTVFEFKYGKDYVKLETGLVARQSTSSVIASMGDTVILVSVVYGGISNIDKNFLPLSVYYQEKFYSVGRIPGGFFKREYRLSDNEIIISRLIDRSIRPLFRKNIFNDIQIVVNVISVDPQVSTEIISIIGVSAALNISGIPFLGPIGVCRIGYLDNKYILNPSFNNILLSKLNLIMSGTENSLLMIDCSSNNLVERIVLDAIYFGFVNFQKLINNIRIFSEKFFSKNKLNINLDNSNFSLSLELKCYIKNFCKNRLLELYFEKGKRKRLNLIKILKDDLLNSLKERKDFFEEYLVMDVFYRLEKKIMIDKLVLSGIRIDGRKQYDIRNLDIKIGFLPKRVHGSALFTRGETQALVVVTLGTFRDVQNYENIYLGDCLDRFIFHYNFPPYSVGETGNIGIPKRREIGHGYLSKKGIIPLLPRNDVFPYTIRVVSEITESNGSSSMASVCGASLALMDAGVPIKTSVAGIAMGLIKSKDKVIVLSDIVGDEDRLGDMDFKIIGTSDGITALQMDMKITGIDFDIVEISLNKSKDSRLFILDKMNSVISVYRNVLSPYAPRIHVLKINVDQIKNVIGKGGSVIKSLTDDNNCLIEVDNDGTVKIVSYNENSINNVVNRIKEITAQVELGEIYNAKIVKIVSFGLFVSFMSGKEGLVHISQVSPRRINNIFNYFKLGQNVSVKVLDIDNSGKIKLSIKQALK